MRYVKARQIWQVKAKPPCAGHPGRKFQSNLKRVPGHEKVDICDPYQNHRKVNWRKKGPRKMQKFMRETLNFHPVLTPTSKWEPDPKSAVSLITPNCNKGKGPIGADRPTPRARDFGTGMDHESHAQMSQRHEDWLGSL